VVVGTLSDLYGWGVAFGTLAALLGVVAGLAAMGALRPGPAATTTAERS